MSIPMNRRCFLRRAFAVAAVTFVAPEILAEPLPEVKLAEPAFEYFSGAMATNNCYVSAWQSKTPSDILADMNAMLERLWEGYSVAPEELSMPVWCAGELGYDVGFAPAQAWCVIRAGADVLHMEPMVVDTV